MCFAASANRENWTQNSSEHPRDRSLYFDLLLRADFETRERDSNRDGGTGIACKQVIAMDCDSSRSTWQNWLTGSNTMIDPLVVPQARREFGGIKHMQDIESAILY